jgi:hypothetical protein
MRVTATLLAAIGVLACRSSIARDADAVIRDSAGVTIVESARPLRVVAATIDSLPLHQHAEGALGSRQAVEVEAEAPRPLAAGQRAR